MKKLIDSLKQIHPLAAMASIGVGIFVTGVLLQIVTTIPLALMWIGGAIIIISGLIAIGGDF